MDSFVVFAGGVFQSSSSDYTLTYEGSNVWALVFTVAPVHAPIAVLDLTVGTPLTVTGTVNGVNTAFSFNAPGTPIPVSNPGYPGSIKCEQIVMEASMDGDIAPILASAPSLLSSLSDLNKVQVAILNGGPVVQTMGWKWNRVFPTPLLTNSWQQDYASNQLNIAWLENCQAIDVNSTTIPKPAADVSAAKDLSVTNVVGWPRYICWLPNNQLMYGTWGGASLNNEFGLTNPGANVAYVNPLGANLTPSNPITQIQDPNGNLWVLTTYGTCGATQPSWPSAPTFPTYVSPTTTATTVADGTCVWTAINPYAQGFRITPIPSQTGKVWGIRPLAQAKPVYYTSMESYITPIPDDLYTYFSDGFRILTGLKSSDAKVRAKYQASYALWIQSLDNCVRSGNREPDNFIMTPTAPVQQPAWGYCYPRPDFPFGGGW